MTENYLITKLMKDMKDHSSPIWYHPPSLIILDYYEVNYTKDRPSGKMIHRRWTLEMDDIDLAIYMSEWYDFQGNKVNGTAKFATFSQDELNDTGLIPLIEDRIETDLDDIWYIDLIENRIETDSGTSIHDPITGTIGRISLLNL